MPKLSLLAWTTIEAVLVLFIAPWLGAHLVSLIGLDISPGTAAVRLASLFHIKPDAFGLDVLGAAMAYALNGLAGLLCIMTLLMMLSVALRVSDRTDGEV